MPIATAPFVPSGLFKSYNVDTKTAAPIQQFEIICRHCYAEPEDPGKLPKRCPKCFQYRCWTRQVIPGAFWTARVGTQSEVGRTGPRI